MFGLFPSCFYLKPSALFPLFRRSRQRENGTGLLGQVVEASLKYRKHFPLDWNVAVAILQKYGFDMFTGLGSLHLCGH